MEMNYFKPHLLVVAVQIGLEMDNQRVASSSTHDTGGKPTIHWGRAIVLY
jgi:hypothetical protein